MYVCTFFNLITHHAQAKKSVNWGMISQNNYAPDELNIVQSDVGLLRTPGASLRASLRASPGRHLGVVRPERPNSKGRQQGVAKRKCSGGST